MGQWGVLCAAVLLALPGCRSHITAGRHSGMAFACICTPALSMYLHNRALQCNSEGVFSILSWQLHHLGQGLRGGRRPGVVCACMGVHGGPSQLPADGAEAAAARQAPFLYARNCSHCQALLLPHVSL